MHGSLTVTETGLRTTAYHTCIESTASLNWLQRMRDLACFRAR